MNKKRTSQYITFLLATFLITACANAQGGIVTPASEGDVVSVGIVETSVPDMSTTENIEPTEDFSNLWVEYWNPVFNYGLALPAHWEVSTETDGGYMTTRSYDQAYFDANSLKGEWIGGQAPEGAVKMDFVPFTDVDPEQSLETAISNLLGADPEMTVVLSVEEVTLGSFESVQVNTARPSNLEEVTTSIAIRLSPSTILLVAAYPNEGLKLSDVKTMFGTLVLDKSTPIIKPTFAPTRIDGQ